MEKSWLVDKGGVLSKLPKDCLAIGMSSKSLLKDKFILNKGILRLSLKQIQFPQPSHSLFQEQQVEELLELLEEFLLSKKTCLMR